MNKKINTDNPCPCRSGKKYKDCCGKTDPSGLVDAYKDLSTGDPVLDGYWYLIQILMAYMEAKLQFDPDGPELEKNIEDFEKMFSPGEEKGVSDSLFCSWLLFDLRYGKEALSVAERFMEENEAYGKLPPDGQEQIEIMSESYATFYQVLGLKRDSIEMLELGTGAVWKVRRVNEPFEKEAAAGDIWFVRLFGGVADAYIFTPPYIYPPEAKEDLTDLIKKITDGCIDEAEKNIPRALFFMEVCKYTLPDMLDFILAD